MSRRGDKVAFWRAVRLAGAGVVVWGANAAGQGVDAPRPEPRPRAPFTFPHVERRTLSNGLRLLIVENHSIPLVWGRIVLDADSLLQEPAGKEGILQFDLAMLPEGTTTSSGDQVAAKMAAVGNGIVIGNQLDFNNNLSFAVSTPDLGPTLNLVGELFAHPAFSSDAVERVRATQLATLRALKTRSPGAWIPLRIFQARLHGAIVPRGATEASLASISRQDLVDFHSQYIRPQLTTLVLVGDVNAAIAVSMAQQSLGGWPRGGVARILPDSSGPPPSTTIYLFDRPGGQQATIVVGTLGPTRDSPDRAAVDMLNGVFDQQTDSRLGTDLRAQHGYAYAIFQGNTLPRAPSPRILAAYSSVATAKTDSALIEWISVIRGLAMRPPNDSEMAFARGLFVENLPGTFETSVNTSFQVANTVARSASRFDDSYPQRVRGVAPSDVTAAAAKYLDPAHLTIVIAGDRKVIEAPLRAANIAPVVVVDENGKPVP